MHANDSLVSWPRPAIPALPAASPGSVPDRISIFDSAADRVRTVGPAEGTARLYVCGITPYDATHLGHAFTYLTFDLLQRAWLDAGLDVQYVQNVTDVDDPLLERATQIGVDWRELAADQTDLFRSDMAALRIIPPDDYVAATQTIDEVAELIEQLRGRDLVYQLDDEYPDWYFRCSQAAAFGQVAHLDRDGMLAEFAEHGGDPERRGKEDELDCLVWRQARPGEPSWPSTLGEGRPGWHIECTAIARNRLGSDFDVQGGGRDLIFPHHDMCHAEGTAVNGEPFADAYVHVGMVGYQGEKMSKSLGNLELVSRLISSGFDPMEVRLALLTHHFQEDWEWFATDMDVARRRADAWRAAFRAESGTSSAPVLADLRRAMRTNLNAPQALAVVDEWTSAVLAGDGDDPDAPGQVAQIVDALLGVHFDGKAEPQAQIA